MLETERLILRPPRPADLAPWTAFFTQPRARFLGGGDGDAALAWRVFAQFLGHWALEGTGPFILCDRCDGTPLGSAGPWFPAGWPERELTWALWSEAAEGQGLAAEAVRALQAHVAGAPGWTRAVSYIDPQNRASIRLAERLGCWEDPQAATPDEDPVRVFVHPV